MIDYVVFNYIFFCNTAENEITNEFEYKPFLLCVLPASEW